MRKRQSVFLILFLAYTSIYIERLNLSMANPSLIEEQRLDAAQIGFLGSAFSTIYALGRLIICCNILAQNFNQPAPNLVWVCDFTYIRVAGSFYYVCAVLDLFSRKFVAYNVSSIFDTQLTIDTLNTALNAGGDVFGLMFHADLCWQFTAKRFRQYLDSLNIVQSFSAKGHLYDNAVMKYFFKYLKKKKPTYVITLLLASLSKACLLTTASITLSVLTRIITVLPLIRRMHYL